jgi:transglutaminase-like putative cysteine protease
LRLPPECEREEFIDQDRKNSYFRLIAPEGKLAIAYQAIVESKYHADQINTIEEKSPAELPLDVVPYLYPWRYCQSDRLMKLAQDEFGNCQPGYNRVEAICDWIYNIR